MPPILFRHNSRSCLGFYSNIISKQNAFTTAMPGKLNSSYLFRLKNDWGNLCCCYFCSQAEHRVTLTAGQIVGCLAAHKSKALFKRLLFEHCLTVFIAKIRYTWFILLCKKITLNPLVVRILKTPKCNIHNNVGQANNFFYRNLFEKKKWFLKY